MPKITIAIPSHNNASTIFETLRSCAEQDYPDKEILVIDDASTDNTVEIVKCYGGVRLIVNEQNLGIGKNLQKLMQECQSSYIIYLCADDIFTHPKVVSDVVNQFNRGDPAIGVLGRYFYFFMHGLPGAIGTCRDTNILTNSCCPSGMAFRVDKEIESTNRIFIEMPYIVSQYLKKWRWSMFEYDTVAARFKPGTNTGTKPSYYIESPLQNWIDLTGDKHFEDYPSFIMLKNRATMKLLWREICLSLNLKKQRVFDLRFWLYALTALLVPRTVLKPLTSWYRNRIGRLNATIIERPIDV